MKRNLPHDRYYHVYRSSDEPRRGNLLSTLLVLILIVVAVFLGIGALPYAQKALSSYAPAPTTVIIATQRPITTGGGRTTTNPAPAAAPISNPNVANSDAEADALYATAVAAQSAPAPDPNAYNPDKPALPAAIVLPTISAAQAESYANRGSGGCAEGQVFVPRVGCHTPGSGGAMPGSVGAP